MDSFACLWEEANRFWILPLLYEDLREVKGRQLTPRQKARLRGALCGAAIADVAEALANVAKRRTCNPKALRVELSRGLYRYIETLLWNKGFQIPGGISWQQIPMLLTSAGYRRASSSEVREILESISAPPLQVRASEILEAVEEQRLKNRLENLKTTFPLKIAKKLDHDGDSAGRNNDFESAINFYRIPIERDPSQIAFLVKISMCFDNLNRYGDAVDIALATLSLTSDEDHISKLNGVLGGAFHGLAVHTLNEIFLMQALDYYDKATHRPEGSNILSIWNSFDLIVSFMKLKLDKSGKYLTKAKLIFCDFLDFLMNERFKIGLEVRQLIHEDLKKIRPNIDDKWLCEKIDMINAKWEEEFSGTKNINI